MGGFLFDEMWYERYALGSKVRPSFLEWAACSRYGITVLGGGDFGGNVASATYEGSSCQGLE